MTYRDPEQQADANRKLYYRKCGMVVETVA